VVAADGAHQASENERAVAVATEEQKAASGEIARNLTEAVMATQRVSQSVAKVAGATQTSAQGIEQVSLSSSDLSQHASILLKQIDEFLGQLNKAA